MDGSQYDCVAQARAWVLGESLACAGFKNCIMDGLMKSSIFSDRYSAAISIVYRDSRNGSKLRAFFVDTVLMILEGGSEALKINSRKDLWAEVLSFHKDFALDVFARMEKSKKEKLTWPESQPTKYYEQEGTT